MSIAFKDIHPKAPVHILIVPKQHHERPEQLTQEELHDLFSGSEQIAKIMDVKETGYRLLFNIGRHAGQVIDHVHLHLLGGKQSKEMY